MGPSQFHRVSLSFIGFSRSDVRLSALVRLSRSLQLTLFSQPPFDHLLAVVATASRTGQFEGQFISRSSDQHGIIFHGGFSSNMDPAFVSSIHTSLRELGYYLSIYRYTVYTYMHLLQTRRGESIFLLSFQSCRAPFRSFHSRTGSSINHRISLTLVLFFPGSFANVDIAKSSLLGRDWFFFFFFLCIVSLGRVSVSSKQVCLLLKHEGW